MNLSEFISAAVDDMPSEPTVYAGKLPLLHVLAPGLVWLNGDGRVRARAEATRNLAFFHGVRSIIVPYAALQAASAGYQTIEPVEIQPERFERVNKVSRYAPAGMEPVEPSRSAKVGELLSWGFITPVYFREGNYQWKEVRHWLGDSVFTAERLRSRAYFLSSFDRQEDPPLYFLSQLPGPAETVEAALELLEPDSVKMARDLGRRVIRQGDIFAIETDITTAELVALGAVIKRRRVWPKRSWASRLVDATPLFGTAHTATEVATLVDDDETTQYARGMLYHDPAVINETRRPDHRRRKLGTKWHLIARNTVPVKT